MVCAFGACCRGIFDYKDSRVQGFKGGRGTNIEIRNKVPRMKNGAKAFDEPLAREIPWEECQRQLSEAPSLDQCDEVAYETPDGLEAEVPCESEEPPESAGIVGPEENMRKKPGNSKGGKARFLRAICKNTSALFYYRGIDAGRCFVAGNKG